MICLIHVRDTICIRHIVIYEISDINRLIDIVKEPEQL